MKIRPQTSHSRSAYLQGFSDRRRDRSCRPDYAGALEAAYLDGWRDAERLPRVAKPSPVPDWIRRLISPEERAA